jgi:hypothetical protein
MTKSYSKNSKNSKIYLFVAFIMLLLSITIFYFMYQNIKKIGNDDDSLELKIKNIDSKTTLIYYGSSLIICITLFVSSLLYYYGFRLST